MFRLIRGLSFLLGLGVVAALLLSPERGRERRRQLWQALELAWKLSQRLRRWRSPSSPDEEEAPPGEEEAPPGS